MKLDFLQKYSTLERALELPTMVQHLETAGKAVPLREKVSHAATAKAAAEIRVVPYEQSTYVFVYPATIGQLVARVY